MISASPAAGGDFPLNWGPGTDQRQQAAELLHRYGSARRPGSSTRASAVTRGAGKALLVALNYTARTDHFPDSVAPWDGTRRDQEILDHLSASGIPLFDMNDVHQREYEQADGPYHEYLSQYMNGGHYNPRGNHLFAYAIKDTLVELLDPKPLAYQYQGPDTIDFSTYRPSA